MTSLDLIDFLNPTCKLPTLNSMREWMPTLQTEWLCHSFYLPPRLTGATTRSTKLLRNSFHRPSAKLNQCHTVGPHQAIQYLNHKATTLRARWSNSLTQTSRPSTTHSDQTDMMSAVTPCLVCLPPIQGTMLPYRHPLLLQAQVLIPRRPSPVAHPHSQTSSPHL